MFSVIFLATSGLLVIKWAGLHSSWRSVCHRKSSSNRFSFPGARRVPRPTIWLYKARTFVGLNTTTQSTVGQSHPSVNSIELHNTLYLSLSKSSRTSARSLDSPLTSAALNPLALRISRNFCDVLTSGKKTTVFLSLHCLTISSAICSR